LGLLVGALVGYNVGPCEGDKLIDRAINLLGVLQMSE